MNLKALTKRTSFILVLILCFSPVSHLVAEENINNQSEVSQQLLSIYFRAYSFVLGKIEVSNISLETNLSISGVCCLDINLSREMSIKELLNLSYSLAIEANMLVDEGNYSDACLLVKKALNLLRSILTEIHKIQVASNLTITPVGTIARLQVAFERHKRLLSRLNLSIQKMQNITEINTTLINQLYLNISNILEKGPEIAMHNLTQAVKMLSEANKAMTEIKKEVVKSSQIAKAEEMFNRTLSKLNLTAVPEDISSVISNLTKEFNEAKARGDVKKAKEVLKEIKTTIAQIERKVKAEIKQKGVKEVKPPHTKPPAEEKPPEEKGKGKGESKGKGKGKG